MTLSAAPFLPDGTVYGTLLNFRHEQALWAARATEPPYKAPPQAPVLFIKTANTFSAQSAAISLPADVPGLPGVTSWNGASFRPTVERARRIFPHHFGSWGFFVALLRKDPNSTRVARTRRAPNRVPEPPRDDPQARAIALEYLRETLGVAAEDLEGAMVLGRGRDFFALNRGAERFDLGKLKVVAPGMRLIHRAGRGLQATNAALRWLGPRITKNVVDLDLALAAEALETNELAVSAPDAPLVALRVDGVVAAKGHVFGGRLGLEIPRGWR